MARIVLDAKTGKQAINGTQLASVTSGNWPRWIEIAVYALDDGGYAVHRVGKSVLYHRADTQCTTARGAPSGHPVTVDNLPDDATPCRKCRPPEPEELADLKDEGEEVTIRLEMDRPVLALFRSAGRAQDFIVTVRDRFTGRLSKFVSEPVQDLLDRLREADPVWAELPWPESTTDNPEGTVKQKRLARDGANAPDEPAWQDYQEG